MHIIYLSSNKTLAWVPIESTSQRDRNATTMSNDDGDSKDLTSRQWTILAEDQMHRGIIENLGKFLRDYQNLNLSIEVEF